MNSAPRHHEIAAAIEALDQAARLSERHFQSMGNCLANGLQLLTRIQDGFSRMQHEWEAANMMQAQADLREAITEVGHVFDLQRADGQALRDLLRLVADIPHHAARLQEPVDFVSTLAVNVRLACSELSGSDASVSEFAEHVEMSADKMRASVDVLNKHLVTMYKECEAADGAYAGLLANEATQAVALRLSEALGNAKTHREDANQAASTVCDRSATIKSQIFDAVRAMQLGDIVRQRIEHVQQIASLLTVSPPGTPAALGWAIAAAQLNDTADELELGTSSIERALSSLSSDAREIARSGKAAFGVGSGSYLGVLKIEVRLIGTALSSLHGAFAIADERIVAAHGAAAEVVRQVARLRNMESDIHLTGLNASFRCARLGDSGKALSVIAQMLRQCGRDFAAVADAVRLRVNDIASQAAKLADAGRRGKIVGIQRYGAVMTAAVEQFASADRLLVDALHGLDHDSALLASKLEEGFKAFAVRQEITAAVRGLADQMQAWAAHGDSPGETTEQARAMLLQRIASGYTMARERVVQASQTGEAYESDPVIAPEGEFDLDSVLL
jgi:methyl-accepting chemotaxis protein